MRELVKLWWLPALEAIALVASLAADASGVLHNLLGVTYDAMRPLALLATGFVIGYTARWQQERIKRHKRTDALRRFFLVASPRMKAITTVALDEGSVHLSEFDQDAAALCVNGVLGTPPFGFRFQGLSYSMQPVIVDTLMKHRVEWLGDMTTDEARSIIDV